MAKTKYTKELGDKIAGLVAQGNYQCVAAAAMGIHEATYYRWLNRFGEFREAIEKAEAVSEAKRVQVILKASEKSWQAAAWYLERKHHQRWIRKQQMQVAGHDGGPVQVQLTGEEYLKSLQVLKDEI